MKNSLQDCLNIKRNIMINKILIKLRILMNSMEHSYLIWKKNKKNLKTKTKIA